MTQDYECLDVTKGEIRNKLTTEKHDDQPLLSKVSESDIFFAKERLGLHKATPEEGVSLQVLKIIFRKSMEYEIKIKPLVLFDLEDKMVTNEQQIAGSGQQFYDYFLSNLASLQKNVSNAVPVYQAVNEYVAADSSCRLFYVVSDATIYVMGLR